MKRIKKILASLMVVVMVLTTAPLSGFVGMKLNLDWLSFDWLDFNTKASAATYSGTCGDNLTWTFDNETGELVISGTGTMYNYDGWDNNYAPWNSYCSSIEKVTIGDGVTSIGSDAFEDCTSLTSITIPDSLTSIGSYAFYYCSGLTSVIIPDSVTSIGSYAFSGCTSLTSVTIPDSVISISYGIFKNCTSLTSITIPDSVTSIGYNAFYYCTSLTSIKIGDGVTSIGSDAFEDCISLTSITIPDSVTSIGYYAFRDCTSLTSITIGNGVTSIGSDAFYNTGYYNDSSNWEDDVLYIGNHLIEANTSISGAYTIKEGTKCIAECAFIGCTSLTGITIPDSIIGISNYSFHEHYESMDFNIIYNGTLADWCAVEIGGDDPWDDTYYNLGYPSKLYIEGKLVQGDIVIPEGVERIGSGTFSGCTGITSVTIPDSVTSIGIDAFTECDNLREINLGEGVERIEGFAFGGCGNLERVNYSGTINDWCSIEFGLFYSNPLEYCNNLYIGGKLVEGDVVLLDGITQIGSGVFCCFYRLKSLVIPSSVTSIGSYVFCNCTSLTNITIPDSVTSIGEGAFEYCTSLTDVYYSGTEEQWNKIDIGSYNDDLLNANIHFNGMSVSGSVVNSNSNDVVITPYGEKTITLNDEEFFDSKGHKKLTSATLKINSSSKSNSSQNPEFIISASEAQSAGVKITSSGYRDYIIPEIVMNSWSTQVEVPYNNSAPGYTHNAYMQLDRKDGKPYVSTVFGRKSPTNEYKELKTAELKVKKDAEYDIVISLGGVNGSEKYTYYLSQDANHKIESNTGVFNKVVLSERFERGKKIYAYAKSESGVITELQEVKLNLDTGTAKDWLEDIQNSTTFNLLGKDFLKVTVPSSVPLIGEAEISLDAFQMPAGFEFDGENLKISIGANIFDWESEYDYETGEYNERKFTAWKDLVTSTTQTSQGSVDARERYKKAQDNFFLDWGNNVAYRDKKKNWDINALGYIDATIINGEIVVKEAMISIEGRFTFKYTSQVVVWGVPAYFYVQAGGAVGFESNGTRVVADPDMPFEWDLTFKVTPELTVGGGVGIKKYASVGLYANATLPIRFDLTNKHLTIQLTGEFGVEAEAWFIKPKIKILDGTVNVVDTYWGKNTRFVTQSNPITGEEETYVITYEVVGRDYLENTSQWLGGDVSFDTMALSQGGMTLETLQSSVFDSGKPQIVAFGDKMLMTWIEDDASRDEYNRMRLMYSVFDGATWTEPKAVYDNGCNDNQPVIVTDGEDVYFAWQKLSKALNEEEALDYNSIIENCEIYIAKYDSSADAITGVKRVTDNSVYDYAHNVSVINGTPYVYWVTCNDNNMESGSDNTLKKAFFDGATCVIKSDLNYILDLDAAYVNGKENVSYSMDADGNTLTVNDVNVFTLADGVSTPFSKQSDVAYTTAFYGEFNGETVLFVSDMSNIYYVEDGEVKSVFTNERTTLENINYVANNGEGIFIWTENNSAGNDVYSSTFENGSWTTPIVVSNEDTTLLTSVDATMYNGQFRGVCMSTDIVMNDETQSYEAGQTDLCTFTIAEMQDIAVDSIMIDERDIEIGKETSFNVYVTNNGSETIKNVTFTVSDGLGFTKTFTKEVNLASGDYKAVTLTYMAPENYSATELNVTVSCAEIADEKSDNDTTSVKIGTPKIILSESSVYTLGSDYIITAVVTNESDLIAQNVDVLVSFDSGFSDICSEFTIEELGARESSIIEFVVPRENVEFDENGIAKVYMTAEFGEDRSNNVCVILENTETVCEHPVTEEITVDSTCNEAGYHSLVCSGCGETISSTEIPKKKHNYENGACIVCGEVAVISKYNDSTTVIDYANRFIYGLASGLDIDTVFSEYAIHSDQVYYHYDGNKVGTDAKVSIYDNDTDELIGEYTFIIFGDVNGDSWYDGQDAIIVDCLANGMLKKEDVSEAVYTAADCNHDGVIDQLDVDLLNQAGALLSNVDQSKPAEVLLETSSEYVEYLDLIDQSPEIEDETDAPDADVETEDTTPEQGAKVDIFEMIMNFIKSIFEMLLSYITMPL